MEELPRVLAQSIDGRILEAPVERAQEVAAVASVERQERGRLPHEIRHEARPARRRQVAAGEPGVGVDDVGGHQRVLEVEHGEMPVGREDGPPLPVRPLVHHRAAGLGADASVLEHRRKVDLVHVVVPIDGGRIEFEPGMVVAVTGLPQRNQVVHPVARVGLGVGAVELDVAEGTLGQRVPVLHPGGQLRLLAADRQGSDHLFHERHGRIGAFELPLDPPPPGEGPLGHVDGLAPVVVEGVAAEEVLRQLDEVPVAQRVPHARTRRGTPSAALAPVPAPPRRGWRPPRGPRGSRRRCPRVRPGTRAAARGHRTR